MSGVNKVIIIGNLGNDPESHSFPDGGMATNISVATSEKWKDKTTGQPKEVTEWHRIVCRDRGNFRLGAIAAEYLRKGSKVYIEGRLKTRKWQDSNGQDRYTTEIIADQMQMLDSRQQGGQQGGGGQSYQQPQQNQSQQPQQNQSQQPNQNYNPQAAAQGPQGGAPGGDFGNFDDDIPF